MTAHAATIVAALHVSQRIKDYGSYAGFACVLGLAVLALLYFAQAREVKRLREWAGRAPERDADLQARVTADAQQRAAVPAAAPVPAKPASAAATPAGQAVSAKPATPASAAAASGATPGQQPAAKPGQPAQPAQAPVAQPPAPKPGVPAPATAAAAAAGAASASPATAKPDAPKGGDGAMPAPATPTPATPAGASPNGAVDQPTQITPAPAAAATSPKPPPKPGQPLRPPPPVGGREPVDDGHSPLRATLMIVGGVLGVIAVVLVLVLVVFSGSDKKKTPNTIGNAPATTPSSSSTTGSKSTPKTAPVSRGEVTVAVLNGTTVPGLARGAGSKVQNAGFKLGTVTNAPDQARSATVVAYAPGHQNEARVVARIVGVGADAIKPIDPSTAVVAGQDAFVVVTVGADQSQ
jgi:hypothetical protein